MSEPGIVRLTPKEFDQLEADVMRPPKPTPEMVRIAALHKKLSDVKSPTRKIGTP